MLKIAFVLGCLLSFALANPVSTLCFSFKKKERPFLIPLRYNVHKAGCIKCVNVFHYLRKMDMDHQRFARSDSGSDSDSNSNEVRTFSFLSNISDFQNLPSLNLKSPFPIFLQGHHCSHDHHCCHYLHWRTHSSATATAHPVASQFTSANYCSSCYHHRRSHNYHCCSDHHHRCSNHHRLIESDDLHVQYNLLFLSRFNNVS